MLRMIRSWLLLALLSLAGCGDNTNDLTGFGTANTLVAVEPSEFLNTLRCTAELGNMQHYVATFLDITPGLDPADDSAERFQLASSPPVDCNQTVATGFGVAGHLYVAHIDGYDRTDIQPLAPGSPIMAVADGSGAIAEPRWQTDCTLPAECVALSTEFVRGCTKLDAPVVLED